MSPSKLDFEVLGDYFQLYCLLFGQMFPLFGENFSIQWIIGITDYFYTIWIKRLKKFHILHWTLFSKRDELCLPKIFTECASMFLIHLWAWFWGSIISGQRRPLVTMTPFSVEKLSLGRPWMFQSRTFVGETMNSLRLKLSLIGSWSLITWKQN